MKYKCGIGIFIFLFVLIYFMSYGAYHEYKNTHNIKNEENIDSMEEAQLNEGYYLYEINGYVVVYKNDKTTPYEYTDIKCDELPELLKTEIKNGKFINTDEELYGFLENYTS